MPKLRRLSDESSPGKDFVLTKENASVIRGIILTYERDGCTLEQIKRGYVEHEGIKLQHKLGDNELRKVIESIEYIRSHEKSTGKGTEIFYYSEHPGQSHLAKLIRKQKPSKIQSPKDSPMLKNGNRKPRAYWRNSSKPRANSTIKEDNTLGLTHSCCGSSNQSDVKDNETCFGTMQKITPRFHGCPMIGDDFFTTMATIDLGYPKPTRTTKVDSTCVNGLTIKNAISKLDSHIDGGSIIIVNLGSNDILNDKPLISLMEDMVKFISTCKKKKIIPILTTLAPMPAYNLSDRFETLTNFNRFLMVNPFGCPVIDLNDSFINFNEKIDFHAYQPEPRNAIGRRAKILMWNQVGRKRVMQKIANLMGELIVDIYAAYADLKVDVLRWHFEDIKNCSTPIM